MVTATDLCRTVAAFLAPPPDYTVSEWADRYRKLSQESSALPGQWRTSVVEYMREPMDVVTDPEVRRVVVKAAAQVAKSELLNNIIGYLIDYDPCPILMVQPTIELAEDYSKDRVTPMIRDTPVLHRAVADDKTRDSNNTIKNKKFPGGYLVLTGANAPSGLASRPIRAVLADEVDRAPMSAGKEGDPINLAIKRTATFWNRIVVLVSTPTDKGNSRIEDAYDEGDQRVRKCVCPHCDHPQELRWAGVKWDNDDPGTARYMCEECGVLWDDTERIQAVRAGFWEAKAPFNGIASFHVPGLLSPFVRLSEAVFEFLEAQSDPAKLKVWVNTYLGETWEEQGQRLDSHSLKLREEEYESTVPLGVTVITAGVDVQDDRIEVETVGWGSDFESWSIDYTVFYGDPSVNDVWERLTQHLKQLWEHPEFGDMPVSATCIDTGHFTARVYQYIRASTRVYGIKGIGGEDKPLVGSPTRNNYGKIHLFPVGTHTAKSLVFDRLRADPGNPGYCHFPKGRDDEYYEQFTAEKLVTRFHRGYKRQEYVKTRARNEALDVRVYATVALELLNVNLKARRRAMRAEMRRIKAEADADQKTLENSSSILPKRRRGGFTDRWKSN